MAAAEWEEVYDDLATMLDGADEFELACLESDPFVILPSSSSSIPATISITTSNDDTEQTAKKSKTTGFKPTSKRRSSRDELRNLQVTVRQLETRLAMLCNRSSKDLGSAETGDTVASKVWEAVASRQLRELDRSERENARLRARVQEQLRVIKSLERLVMKRRKVPSYIPQPSPFDGVRDAVNDLVLERQIEKEVLAMLTGVDFIADDPRFNAILNTPVHMSKSISHENDRLAVETLDRYILPFDYHAAADALWTMWKTVPMDLEHEMARDNMRSTESALWRVDAGSLESIGSSLRFRSKFICRRRIEENRVVMTGILLMCPLDMDGGSLTGVNLQLRVWNIFSPVQNTGGIPITTRQMYTQCSLETQGEAGDEKSAHTIKLLTNFLLHGSRARAEMNNQVLENQLLKQFSQLRVHDTQTR